MNEGIGGIKFNQTVLEDFAGQPYRGRYETVEYIPLTESEKAGDLSAWIVAAKSVPEPGIMFLFGSGLCGLAV